MSRNYIAEIKEREAGQPCFLFINLSHNIGLGEKSLFLDLPEGTGLDEANALRDALHESGAIIRLA